MSSIVLYIIGALTLVVGVGTIGYGIPIYEFSFGNTLIGAGAAVAVGGLVVMALAAVIAELKRLGEAIDMRAASAPTHEVFDTPRAGTSAPAAPLAETDVAAGRGGIGAFARPMRPLAREADAAAGPAAGPLPPGQPELRPTLPNPDLAPPRRDEAPMRVPPLAADAAATGAPRAPTAPPSPPEPARRQAESRPPAAGEPPPLTAREQRTSAPEPRPDARPSGSGQPEASPPRTATVLKKGVVDGMGYTLYVDGSIEAELPQGTLRFASIHELRRYLERNA